MRTCFYSYTCTTAFSILQAEEFTVRNHNMTTAWKEVINTVICIVFSTTIVSHFRGAESGIHFVHVQLISKLSWNQKFITSYKSWQCCAVFFWYFYTFISSREAFASDRWTMWIWAPSDRPPASVSFIARCKSLIADSSLGLSDCKIYKWGHLWWRPKDYPSDLHSSKPYCSRT